MGHPDQLDIEVPGLMHNFIGGRWQAGSGALVDVISPTTEEVIVQVADPTEHDADLAVAAARDAFDQGLWPQMAVQERISACSRLCDALEHRLDRLNRAWTFESGPTLAHGEMINNGAGVSIWRQALALAADLSWEEQRDGALIWP